MSVEVLPTGVQVDRRFVATEEIAGCVIVEAFRGWEVVYACVLSTRSGESVVVAQGEPLSKLTTVHQNIISLLSK